MQVCQRMGMPGIAVCENFSRIAESFYDVWNRQFIRGLQPEQGYPTYTARVSVGASSDQKRVHPLFKFVLEVPETIENTEMALRNRTEKFVLDISHVLERRLQEAPVPRDEHQAFERDVLAAVATTEAWAHKLGGRSTFCGFIQNNTVPSIMIHFLDRLMSRDGTRYGDLAVLLNQLAGDVIPSDTGAENGSRMLPPTFVPESNQDLVECMLKLFLTQTCLTKQSVMDCLSEHADVHLGHYSFCIQEHLSWSRFLRTTLNRGAGTKVVVYTERCGTVCLADSMKSFLMTTLRPVDPECKIGVLDLSTVRKRQECKDKIRSAFAKEEEAQNDPAEHSETTLFGAAPAASNRDTLHLLTVLVNAQSRHYQHAQLSYVREAIDSYMESHGENVMVLCIVSPTSTYRQLGPAATPLRAGACASLWLNQWDFHYMEPPCYESSRTSIENQNMEALRAAQVHHGVQIWPFGQEPLPGTSLCPDAMLESRICDQVSRLSRAGALQRFFWQASPEAQTRFEAAGFHKQSLVKNTLERKRMLAQLLNWRNGVIKQHLRDQICRHLADHDHGVRARLKDVCSTWTDLARTSLSSELWDAVVSRVDDVCRSFLHRFVTSFPLELLKEHEQTEGLEACVEAAIRWLGTRKLGRPLTESAISPRFCHVPFFRDVDALLSKLVGGPSLAQQESEHGRLATESALEAAWSQIESGIHALARSQANFEHLLLPLSSNEVFPLFCLDAMAGMMSSPGTTRKWSSDTLHLVKSLLVNTARRIARERQAQPLFVYWFLRRHSSMVLDIASILEMLPVNIRECVVLSTGQTVSLKFLNIILDAILKTIKTKSAEMLQVSDCMCRGALGGLSALLRGLLDAESPEGDLASLCTSFIQASLAHFSFEYAVVSPQHILDCIVIVQQCPNLQPQTDARMLVEVAKSFVERLVFSWMVFVPKTV